MRRPAKPRSDSRATAVLSANPPAPSTTAPWLPWAIVLLVILLAAAVRIRLLQIPLERDEGEYAYAGQMILQGIPPYESAFNMKFPGVYGAYALILGTSC